MEWYLKCIRQYVDFGGRARRKEYWMFVLINFIIGLVLGFIDGFLIGKEVISTLYSLFVFLPGLAVGIRRMHDIGKSGWWILIPLIPIVGWIWFIILAASDGERGENQWGVSPKYGPGVDINEFDNM